jgi:hypothetical protein
MLREIVPPPPYCVALLGSAGPDQGVTEPGLRERRRVRSRNSQSPLGGGRVKISARAAFAERGGRRVGLKWPNFQNVAYRLRAFSQDPGEIR